MDTTTSVAPRTAYRAQDIDMAARVDVERRTIMLTGGIDSNDHDILVRLEVPEPGRWTVIKSETNLTQLAWSAWQITLHEGTRVVVDDTAPLMCRQFASSFVTPDRDRFVFYGGEIRPGEPILKQFDLETVTTTICMAHNRFFGPKAMSDPDVAALAVKGFEPKPYVESFVPTEV